MASITLSVNEELKGQLKRFQWVNWSEIAREETIKKLIFEHYLKSGDITNEEWAFCEKIDWHPVDELPIREEHVRQLEKSKKGKTKKYKSVDEFFNALR